MFGLSLADHLRLTFGHVIYTHKVHATSAARHARWDRWLKGAEALFLLVTAVAAAAVVFTPHPTVAMVAAGAAVLAIAVLIVRLAADFERTALAHRACSARLWHLREHIARCSRISRTACSRSRPPRSARCADGHAAADLRARAARRPRAVSVRAPVAGGTRRSVLSDEEIDRFLPASLQKGAAATGNASASAAGAS